MKARIIEGMPPPSGSRSWLDYYVNSSGAGTVLLYCAVCGCPEPPTAAAPMREESGAMFAAPVCPHHAVCREWLELYDFEQTAALK
ncbi:MAG: hypothetical protein AB7F40_03045 [Victivallaceae bacterium]|nr:hypothetical protein [Victivallaceae bacterium]